MVKRALKTGHLYFVYSHSQNAVKVGFADNLYQRVANLQTGNPCELVLGSTVPIIAEAEDTFHEIMKPHRVAREWYPADTLMFMLAGELLEHWGDKVQAKTGRAMTDWIINGDEDRNPSETYLDAAGMRKAVNETIKSFFDPSPEALEEGDDEHLTTRNHWLPKPRGRRYPITGETNA